jgi:acyl-CoA synthetase (NDP forming)
MTNLWVVKAASGHEIIVEVTRDLQFGHAVMPGMGGTLVEVLLLELAPFRHIFEGASR